MVAVAAAAGGAGAATAANQSGPGGPHHVGLDPVPTVGHLRGVPASGSPWQELVHQPPFNPGPMLLLTDGTVLVQSVGSNGGGSPQWWRLTPNAKGSYVDGTWSKVASMSSSYGPLYMASAVLPDGNVIVMGGEYNLNKEVWTNKGALYEPTRNIWIPVPAPSGSAWKTIGDAPSTVLANGTFMLGGAGIYGETSVALFDEANLTWKAADRGKAGGTPETGFTLLPSGRVLTVDVETYPDLAEFYNPSTGSWTSGGKTPVNLIDADGEIGGQILRPNGTVFVPGATGSTVVYSTATGKWSVGPKFPKVNGKQLDTADAPDAVLPDGDVLVVASPGDYTPPERVFDFNGKTLTQVPNPPNAFETASNYVYLMVLPTGQILDNDREGDFMVYNSTGSPNPAWRPSITSVPASLTAGHTYLVSGKQLNGLTQGSGFGDDYQSSTNYPLVRLTNKATGTVVYARTYGMTQMSVAPKASSSAHFTLPAKLAAGTYSLVVVANGIASAAVTVKVAA